MKIFKPNFRVIFFIFSAVLILLVSSKLSAETIFINSEDGIQIIADTYMIDDEGNTPAIVLFHQAGWSRGEYLEIAPKLNQLGFNCIAVDLRSGDAVNDVVNQTTQHAKENDKPTRYIDSLPDMVSALRFVNDHFPESNIIAWGSSYSASLALHIAGAHPDLVDGVLSFAPGEYFASQGKSKSWIEESASDIQIPVFITSALNEKNNWHAIFEAIPSSNKTSFLPSTQGNHGSRALWEQFDDSTEYWDAVTQFLKENFK